MQRLSINLINKEFDLKCEIFQEANLELHEVAQGIPRVRRETIERLYATAHDIISTCIVLDDLVEDYLNSSEAMFDSFNKEGMDGENTKILIAALHRRDRKTSSVVKSLFLFTRSYHDVLATLLLEAYSSKGRSAPTFASMNDLLKKTQESVYIDLCQYYPNYHLDFKKMRETRTKIKYGAVMHGGIDGLANSMQPVFVIRKQIWKEDHFEPVDLEEISFENLLNYVENNSKLAVSAMKALRAKLA